MGVALFVVGLAPGRVLTTMMASSVSFSLESEIVPTKPHQPQSFPTPKRSFGQKSVEKSFHPNWFEACKQEVCESDLELYVKHTMMILMRILPSQKFLELT